MLPLVSNQNSAVANPAAGRLLLSSTLVCPASQINPFKFTLSFNDQLL